LGDILGGCIAVWLYWAHEYYGNQALREKESTEQKAFFAEFSPTILGAFGGCFVTRAASALAFASEGRAMRASNLLKHVSDVMAPYFPAIPPFSAYANVQDLMLPASISKM